jgi:YbbR domain-containing protein
MTQKLRKTLFTNFGWKVVAVVIAALLWWVFLREQELVAMRTIPVLLKNAPAQLVLMQHPGPVQVEIAGPVALLEETQFRGAAVILDLAGVREPGERSFTLGPADLDLPLGTTFRRVVPSQIRLTFEARIQREVAIRLRVGAPPPPGFALADPVLIPATAVVSGPRSRVEPLGYIETDPVDLSGLTGERELTATLALGDPYLALESAPAVTVRARAAPVRAQ